MTCLYPGCTRTPDIAQVCAPCRVRMRDQLRDVVEFYAIAEHELVPGSATGARGSERTIGVRVAALDFLAGHDVVAVLGLWERDWRETYGLADPKAGRTVAATLVEIVKFLHAWLDRACDDHPAIDDFARELGDAWATARSAARMTGQRKTVVDCPTVNDDGTACGGHVTVTDDTDTYCRRCGTHRTIDRLLAIAAADRTTPVWVDPEAAAHHSGIPERTLRHWASKGWIVRSHGRYDLRSISERVALSLTPTA